MRMSEKQYLENEYVGLFSKRSSVYSNVFLQEALLFFPVGGICLSAFFVFSKVAFQISEVSWLICSLCSKNLPFQ